MLNNQEDYKTDLISSLSKFAESFDKFNEQDVKMLTEMIQLLKDNNETDARLWEPVNVMLKSLNLDTIHLDTEIKTGNKLDGHKKPPVIFKKENVVHIDEENHSIVVPQVRNKYAEAWVTPDEAKHFNWEDALKEKYKNGASHYTPNEVRLGATTKPFNYTSLPASTKAIFSYRLLCPKSRAHNFMVIND